MCIRDRVIENKVSDSDSENNNDNYNSDMINNNGDVIKNVVSESEVLNNDSDDEVLMGVQISYEVVVVDEIGRECDERLGEYVGQRANFPCGISGVKTPHVTKVPPEVMCCLLYTSRCV